MATIQTHLHQFQIKHNSPACFGYELLFKYFLVCVKLDIHEFKTLGEGAGQIFRILCLCKGFLNLFYGAYFTLCCCRVYVDLMAFSSDLCCAAGVMFQCPT